MQSCHDVSYNWIMNYQDHHTKFCVLQPLTQKCGKEVAAHLIQIFLTFGAPLILQSDNGREFVNHVIDELSLIWPGCKILHGRSRHPQSQGSIERSNQVIENMLTAWCSDNKTTKWASGLMSVQFSKNITFHRGIGMSPFKAMFGCVEKVGLRTTKLPAEIVDTIRTEEELLELLKSTNQDEFNKVTQLLNQIDAIPTPIVTVPTVQDIVNDSSRASSRVESIQTSRRIVRSVTTKQANEMLDRAKHKCPPSVVGSTV